MGGLGGARLPWRARLPTPSRLIVPAPPHGRRPSGAHPLLQARDIRACARSHPIEPTRRRHIQARDRATGQRRSRPRQPSTPAARVTRRGAAESQACSQIGPLRGIVFTNTWLEFWIPLAIIVLVGIGQTVRPALWRIPAVRWLTAGLATFVLLQAAFVTLVIVLFSIAMAGFDD
jgi:hypothetical protein